MGNRHQNYISGIRASNRKVWEGIQELVAAQQEWNALDYGNTLPAGEGENEGLTKLEIGAVAFDTANAMRIVQNDGHATNMAKLL